MAAKKIVLLLWVVVIPNVINSQTDPCDHEMDVPETCSCKVIVANLTSNLVLDCSDGDVSNMTAKGLDSKTMLTIIGVTKGLSNFIAQLPKLSNLTTLELKNCSNITLPDSFKVPAMQQLTIESSNLTTEQIAELLKDWKALPIEQIGLQHNKINAYPHVFSSLSKLSKVNLMGNQIHALTTKEQLKFNAAVKEIDLSHNKISVIQNISVFQGDFTAASLILAKNPLTSKSSADIIAMLGNKFKKIDLGTVNCKQCFIAHIFETNSSLMINGQITGECENISKKFNQLNSTDFKEKCIPGKANSIMNSYSSFSFMIAIVSSFFIIY